MTNKLLLHKLETLKVWVYQDNMSEEQDIKNRIARLESLIISDPNINPIVDRILDKRIAIHYTTVAPTYIPDKNGVREIYFDGAKYWLYLYTPAGWKKVEIT